MKKLLLLIAIALSAVISASAQNSIDNLVESCKSVGNSKFTSAVERDPATRQVVKVVKVFEAESMSASKFISAFNAETANATTNSQTSDNDDICHTLTFESDNQIRIYSLRYDKGPSHMGLRTTIIIKYIKNK